MFCGLCRLSRGTRTSAPRPVSKAKKQFSPPVQQQEGALRSAELTLKSPPNHPQTHAFRSPPLKRENCTWVSFHKPWLANQTEMEMLKTPVERSSVGKKVCLKQRNQQKLCLKVLHKRKNKIQSIGREGLLFLERHYTHGTNQKRG